MCAARPDLETADAAGGDGGVKAMPALALAPFPRITRAAIEALRYRAEDVARSLTKNVIREVDHACALTTGTYADCG